MLGIKDIAEFEKSGNYVRYTLMPLTKIHLHSDRTDELSPNGSIQYVYIFSAVALLILLIACTNFMNLSTAKSIHRAKEVGVRKVLGSVRKQLIGQFLVESIVLTLVSLLLAVVVAEITLPYFNQLANKSLSLDLFGNFYVISVLLGMALVVGILAGSYPAFYLSAFNPVVVLKGKIKVGTKGKYLRSALVVLQFGISIVLITCTLVIYRQLSFIQNKKVGFNKSQVLIINDTYTLGKQAQTFKQTVARLPEVERGTVSGNLPVPSGRNNMSYFPEGTLEQDKAISMQCWQIDEDYIQTLGMEIIQGRNFSKQFKTDSSAVIINESTAKLLGFENPIGKKIMRMDNDRDGGGTFFKIIGVVRNFHYESLRQNVQALCMHLAENNTMVSFKLTATTVATALPKIEALWKQFSPNQPFNYTFLDDSFESMYRNEQRIGQIFITFAGLAIFLAGLGLFGLVAFTTEQRTKEIGIRKVLGATVLNIIALISQDFLRLVLIAFLIASPVAYYLMRQWLQEFAYRVELHWLTFVIVGLLTGLIALLTMIYQAVKASLTNPVNVLRNE
jgi:putative ABC transport system permease protein